MGKSEGKSETSGASLLPFFFFLFAYFYCPPTNSFTTLNSAVIAM